jgi:hypothetical protein
MSQGKTTTNHGAIRNWAEARGARPATVREPESGGEHAGILRFDFDPRDEQLEPISCAEFFEKFDDADLAFRHQHRIADGSVSRFHKFVSRASR